MNPAHHAQNQPTDVSKSVLSPADDPNHHHHLSPAEREHRRVQADNRRRIDRSAEHTRHAIGELRGLIPPGWLITAGQHIDGALHTIDVTPPRSGIEVTAYLCPPGDDGGWHVRIHHRTDKVDFPLFSDGGARAARYAIAADALAAAVNALHMELRR